jgi:hypothetical protein
MKKILLTLISVSLFFSTLVQAETVWEYVDKKLEKKKFKRWSLGSWLYTKEKMGLQDQWLSMNIDNEGILTEYYIDYAKSSFDRDTADNTNEEDDGFTGELGAYWGIFGLVGRSEEYGNLYKQKEASLNIRLIGSSHQSTHLTATYGVRDFKGSAQEEFNQNFYGGDVSLYLLPFLGFDGRYRYYINTENSQGTHSLKSSRSQWGMFIDIAFVRFFTYQFEENLVFNDHSSPSLNELQIKGTAAGIRLYF